MPTKPTFSAVSGIPGTGSIIPSTVPPPVTPKPVAPPAAQVAAPVTPVTPPTPSSTTVAQDQAKAARQNTPGFDAMGDPIPGYQTPTPTTPTSTSTISTSTPDLTSPDAIQQKILADKAQAVEDARTFNTTQQNIQNGSIPLSPGQQSMIQGLQAQFQQFIDKQELMNKSATGVASRLGYQGGAGENPLFHTNVINSVASAGAAKILDLQVQMASAVASLTQSLTSDNIKQAKDAYDTLQKAQDDYDAELQTYATNVQKAIKDASDATIAAQKVQYDTITKPIQDIGLTAAKNGAPTSILNAIRNSPDLGSAIKASGGYLQTATGDLGDYLNYMRQKEATGGIAAQYDDWLKAKKAADAAQKSSEAYSSAYGAALGKAAGEKAAGVSSIKPLTEAQSKDLTYAERGSQAMTTIDSLSDKIVAMSPQTYAAQKLADQYDITAQYVSSDMRNIRQAERNFSTAVLRRQSGASISAGEFSTLEAQYFPRPGDDLATLAQKAQNRATEINTIKQNVPDYETRASQTATGILDLSENVATQTVTQYAASNPQAAASVRAMVAAGKPYTEIKTLLGI